MFRTAVGISADGDIDQPRRLFALAQTIPDRTGHGSENDLDVAIDAYRRDCADGVLLDPESTLIAAQEWGAWAGLLHRWRARSGQAEIMRPRPARVSAPRSSFAGFRFPQDVILIAVRWYLRYGLSYRDVEELLAGGIAVDHVTVYRWVQRFTPLLIEAARPCRHAPGDRWFVDETYVKVAGRWVYLYRAIDQFGQIIDVLVSEKRDQAVHFAELALAL